MCPWLPTHSNSLIPLVSFNYCDEMDLKDQSRSLKNLINILDARQFLKGLQQFFLQNLSF